MAADEGDKKFDRCEGKYKRRYKRNGEHKIIIHYHFIAVLDEIVGGSDDHRRNGEEKRKFCGTFTTEPHNQSADKGRTGAAGSGDHRETLKYADGKGFFEVQFSDIFS